MAEVTACVNGERPEDWPLVYSQLRLLGVSVLKGERNPADANDLTGVVHEAWERLQHGPPGGKWQSRAHFYGAACRAMRQALVDRARRRIALKRSAKETPFHDGMMPDGNPPDEGASLQRALDIDAALRRLERIEPRLAEVAEMRLFGNLPSKMIAERLGVTTRTIERDWERASTWLRERLE
jgi:RNA polymerase sigma factor (TIGR02999 family)